MSWFLISGKLGFEYNFEIEKLKRFRGLLRGYFGGQLEGYLEGSLEGYLEGYLKGYL